MSKKFNYAEWLAAGTKKQPFEEFQMFACDWVQPGMTHKQGVEACVEGIKGHKPEAKYAEIRAAVESWGYLGREDE